MTSNASASGVSKPLFSSSAVTSAANKERITLIVDETPFMVDAKLFANHHNTLLGRMFANKNFELKTNSRGEYDIGRGTCLTSSIFRIILVTIFISNIVSLIYRELFSVFSKSQIGILWFYTCFNVRRSDFFQKFLSDDTLLTL